MAETPQERAGISPAGHHERMDGKGYPNGLTREQMSVQARVMGIADIFEALTATDRPYKKARPSPNRSPSWASSSWVGI